MTRTVHDAAPPTPTPSSRGRQVVGATITIVAIVVVFAGVFPQFADYGQAWDAITRLSFASLMLLVVATIVNVIVYVWPFQAAVPGLPFGRAFVVRNTSFMISNVVPAGGAVGLGVQLQMLHTYGARRSQATAAVGVTALWNILATMALPVLAMIALLLTGETSVEEVAIAGIGVLAIAVILGVLVLVFRSDTMARRIGGLAERSAAALLAVVGRRRELHVADSILRFRASTVDVVRARWMRLTSTNLLLQLAQFAILYVALAGIQAGADQVTVVETLAAFAFARLGTFVPITPGGLGTVDAVMVAILTGFGASNPDAVAAVLVWRALTYFPQVLLGVITFLIWRRRSLFAAVPETTARMLNT